MEENTCRTCDAVSVMHQWRPIDQACPTARHSAFALMTAACSQLVELHFTRGVELLQCQTSDYMAALVLENK